MSYIKINAKFENLYNNLPSSGTINYHYSSRGAFVTGYILNDKNFKYDSNLEEVTYKGVIVKRGDLFVIKFKKYFYGGYSKGDGFIFKNLNGEDFFVIENEADYDNCFDSLFSCNRIGIRKKKTGSIKLIPGENLIDVFEKELEKRKENTINYYFKKLRLEFLVLENIDKFGNKIQKYEILDHHDFFGQKVYRIDFINKNLNLKDILNVLEKKGYINNIEENSKKRSMKSIIITKENEILLTNDFLGINNIKIIDNMETIINEIPNAKPGIYLYTKDGKEIKIKNKQKENIINFLSINIKKINNNNINEYFIPLYKLKFNIINDIIIQNIGDNFDIKTSIMINPKNKEILNFNNSFVKGFDLDYGLNSGFFNNNDITIVWNLKSKITSGNEIDLGFKLNYILLDNSGNIISSIKELKYLFKNTSPLNKKELENYYIQKLILNDLGYSNNTLLKDDEKKIINLEENKPIIFDKLVSSVIGEKIYEAFKENEDFTKIKITISLFGQDIVLVANKKNKHMFQLIANGKTLFCGEYIYGIKKHPKGYIVYKSEISPFLGDQDSGRKRILFDNDMQSKFFNGVTMNKDPINFLKFIKIFVNDGNKYELLYDKNYKTLLFSGKKLNLNINSKDSKYKSKFIKNNETHLYENINTIIDGWGKYINKEVFDKKGNLLFDGAIKEYKKEGKGWKVTTIDGYYKYYNGAFEKLFGGNKIINEDIVEKGKYFIINTNDGKKVFSKNKKEQKSIEDLI